MNVLTLLLFGTGGVLIYAGITNTDPRDVLRDSLKNSRKQGKPIKQSKQPKPEPPDGTGAVNV